MADGIVLSVLRPAAVVTLNGAKFLPRQTAAWKRSEDGCGFGLSLDGNRLAAGTHPRKPDAEDCVGEKDPKGH